MAKERERLESAAIRVDGELPIRENRYYKRVSERYRTAGFFLILLFVLFLGVMLVKYGEYITYDNFVYLMRDLDSIRDSSGASDIEYPSAEDGTFSSFKNGLAVHSEGVFTLYDSTGVSLTTKNESMASPAMAAGGEYLLLYDIGGRSYSLYNSLTRVMSRQCDGNIISASVSDGGAFAVTSESDESRYVTEVYGKALNRTMRIYMDKYVVASAVSGDGDAIAVASVSENMEGFGYELSFYKSGEDKALKTVEKAMSFPVTLRALNGGNFVLICDDAVRFYSADGDEVKTNSLEGLSPSCFDATRQGVIVVCRTEGIGGESRVYSYDYEGNIIFDKVIDMKLTGAAATCRAEDETAGYATDGASVVKLGEGELESVNSDEEILAITDTEKGLLICSKDKATRRFIPDN